MTAPLRPDAEASELAACCFGDNMVVCFVGGSYARGHASAASDVDLFVVLDQPDEESERRFAMQFVDLHRHHQLALGHVGEVFSRKTLEHLLTFTERVLEQLPEIQRAGCYHGDCLLSAFRKGDVVFKFLADPKLWVKGDLRYLQALEQQAAAFFERYPMPRVQLSKTRLIVDDPRASKMLREMHQAAADEATLADTPIGIALERWFGPEVLPEWAPAVPRERPAATTSPDDIATCPLSVWAADSLRSALVRQQCLAYCG